VRVAYSNVKEGDLGARERGYVKVTMEIRNCSSASRLSQYVLAVPALPAYTVLIGRLLKSFFN
jgi:hypothetical protein